MLARARVCILACVQARALPHLPLTHVQPPAPSPQWRAGVALVLYSALVAAACDVEVAVEAPVLCGAREVRTGNRFGKKRAKHLVPRVGDDPVVLACIGAPAKQPDRVATKQLACDVFINAGLVAAGRGEEGEGMSGRGWDEAVGRWCG